LFICGGHTGGMADISIESTDGVLPEPEPDSSSSFGRERRHPPGDVLPTIATDEQAIGWGDEATEISDEWYLSERPPHHT